MIRKIVIFVIGSTVILFGVALLVLPGPAFIVIPAGLAILATEFLWARRMLHGMKGQAGRLWGAVGKRKSAIPEPENGKTES